jgi:hypothetical protein
MKFEAAENFVRQGFRREAGRLFLENLRHAPSLLHAIRTAFRIGIPRSLFMWNRRRKQRNAAARFGSLDDVIKQTDIR